MTASNGALGNSAVDEGLLGVVEPVRLRPSKSVPDDSACMREPTMTLPKVHRRQVVDGERRTWNTQGVAHSYPERTAPRYWYP